jgi:hypothetical protein
MELSILFPFRAKRFGAYMCAAVAITLLQPVNPTYDLGYLVHRINASE